MLRKYLLAVPFLTLASAATASVVVLGNYKTGEVVIEGNAGGAEGDRAVALATGGSDAGWTQIYGPDDDQRGWGAVLCVRHKTGFFFAEAIGASSEAEAERIVNLKADRFLARLVGGDDAGQIERAATWPELSRQAAAAGIGEKIKCAPSWNNQGQQISFAGKALDQADGTSAKVADSPQSKEQPTEKPAEQTLATVSAESKHTSKAATPLMPPKRDYEAEYQAKLKVWEQQQAEHRRKVAEHEEAERQVEAQKAFQRQQAQGVLAEYQRKLADHAAVVASNAEERRRWEMAVQGQASGAPQFQGSTTGIADAFKVQNDAEWAKVSKGLPAPHNGPGHPHAYCYQPSGVDSILYHTQLFATSRQKTELELGFADVVARLTRIGSGMSTYCYVTPDLDWLDQLRRNVERAHPNLQPKVLEPPR